VHTNLLRELSSSSKVLSLTDLCWQQQLAVGSLRLLQQSEDPWPSPPSQHLGRSSSSPEQLTPRIPSIYLCWQPATGAVFSTPRPSFRACASAPLARLTAPPQTEQGSPPSPSPPPSAPIPCLIFGNFWNSLSSSDSKYTYTYTSIWA